MTVKFLLMLILAAKLKQILDLIPYFQVKI